MSTILEKHFDQIAFATWENPEKSEVRIMFNPSPTSDLSEMVITTEASNPDFKTLLKRFSIDEINLFTNKEQEGAMATMHAIVKGYAEYNGLVYDPSKEDPKAAINLDMVFDLPDTTQGQDFLFEVKLRAFDVPQIAEASQEVKIAIREADTPIKVMYLVGKHLYE